MSTLREFFEQVQLFCLKHLQKLFVSALCCHVQTHCMFPAVCRSRPKKASSSWFMFVRRIRRKFETLPNKPCWSWVMLPLVLLTHLHTSLDARFILKQHIRLSCFLFLPIYLFSFLSWFSQVVALKFRILVLFFYGYFFVNLLFNP